MNPSLRAREFQQHQGNLKASARSDNQSPQFGHFSFARAPSSGFAACCSCESPSHCGTLLDVMSRFGKKGLSVPAKTTKPSSNFVRAKSFASVSVSNVLVTRGLRLLGSRPRLRTSKVTYQTCGISYQRLMRRSRASPAQGQASRLLRNAVPVFPCHRGEACRPCFELI